MTQYSIEPTTKNYVKVYEFLSIARKCRKRSLDTGLDTLKNVFKKVVHKAAEAKGEYIGNKIADKIGKPKDVIDKNPRSVKEIIISPEK